MYKIISLLIFTIMISSCISQTPGDAAMRSCHAKQAGDLYEKVAIGRKDPIAAIKLARMYDYGISVDHCSVRDKTNFDQDKQKAIYWYKKALEYGDLASNWSIGVIYREGKINVQKNLIEAEKWLLKGAKLAHHYAMYDLADMYASDEVSIPNDIEGLKWLNIVQTMAKLFDKQNEGTQFVLNDTKGVRKILENRMNNSQISKAKNLSKMFIKNHSKGK